MKEDVKIEKTREFLKQEFKLHPHFSFNDWKIMYEHSLLVYDFSMKIATEVECDKTVVAIGALLHDIGKTYEADEATLHARHEELGWVVSQEFISNLGLSTKQVSALKGIFSKDNASVERAIIKDADIVAFLADEKLQSVFIDWARSKGLDPFYKFSKINLLRFELSKKIALPFYKKSKLRWKF